MRHFVKVLGVAAAVALIAAPALAAGRSGTAARFHVHNSGRNSGFFGTAGYPVTAYPVVAPSRFAPYADLEGRASAEPTGYGVTYNVPPAIIVLAPGVRSGPHIITLTGRKPVKTSGGARHITIVRHGVVSQAD